MAFKKEEIEIIEPKDIYVGKKDAPVTLMEFGDYESEACAKVNEVVRQILEEYDGKVKLNFRHFPLTRIHQRSLKASEAAVAAAQEGKFWEMHDTLFANQARLDADALSMIEGVMSVSEMTVRDIMIPRGQMDVVSLDQEPKEFIPLVLETRHSRFPVIGENKDDIVGILLAKELLNYYENPEGFDLRDTLRPAVFVPESKRLNVLLREFRANRNHIAIVVDEYGGVSGLVTIEDVLEQIVGDIEDEHDVGEPPEIEALENGDYLIDARADLVHVAPAVANAEVDDGNRDR